MKTCCTSVSPAKECIRKSDSKVFKLPRRFTKNRCRKGINGFTMRSSCAPYKDCLSKKVNDNNKNKKKNKGGELTFKKNMLGKQIKVCSKNP